MHKQRPGKCLPRVISAVIVAFTVTTFLSAVTAWAAGSDTWTGMGDATSWGDAGNWSSGVPQNGETLTIVSGPGRPYPNIVGVPAGTELAGLTLADAALSGGSITVTGTVSISSTVEAGNAGGAVIDDAATFEGATDISGRGGLDIPSDGKASLTNSGTLTVQPGSVIWAPTCCNGDVGELINTGTVMVPSSTAGASEATLSALDFNDEGHISVGNDSTLDLTSGFGRFAPGDDITGGGTFELDQGEQLALANPVAIAASTTVEMGSSGNSTLVGSGAFMGPGRFLWTGGTIDADLDVAATVGTTINGPQAKALNINVLTSANSTPAGPAKPVLALHGPTVVEGSGILGLSNSTVLDNSGTLTVEPGAEIQADDCCTSATGELTNAGTLQVPGNSSSGPATLDALDFADQGSVSVGTGSRLYLGNGFSQFRPGVSIAGGGTFEVDQAELLTLAPKVSIGQGTTLELGDRANPDLVGTGSLVGPGKFLWTGGTIDADLTIGKTISTSITGNATKSFDGNVLTPEGGPAGPSHPVVYLQGSTTLIGPGQVTFDEESTLVNSGTLTMGRGATLAGEVCCTTPDHFTNSGTLLLTSGSGTATVTSLAFTNEGTVKVKYGTFSLALLAGAYLQTSGSTELAGGSLLSPQQPVRIAAGVLSGPGTVRGSVVNSGTVEPGTTGILTVSGSYQQTGGGVLAETIAGTTPGSGSSELVIHGSASLGGTLRAITAGGFVPAGGQSVSVVTYGSRSGAFSDITGNHPFVPHYGANVLSITYEH